MEAEDDAAAEALIRADPFFAAGVIVGWQIFPLAYWSAQAARGEH